MEQPYIDEVVTMTVRKYNPAYGDKRMCECGHPYHRHFDSYSDMHACGCKYCDCFTFKEVTPNVGGKRRPKAGAACFWTSA